MVTEVHDLLEKLSITKTSCFFFSCYVKSDVDWLKTTIKIEMENGFVSFSLCGKIGVGIPGPIFISMALWVGGVKKNNVTDNGGVETA